MCAAGNKERNATLFSGDPVSGGWYLRGISVDLGGFQIAFEKEGHASVSKVWNLSSLDNRFDLGEVVVLVNSITREFRNCAGDCEPTEQELAITVQIAE